MPVRLGQGRPLLLYSKRGNNCKYCAYPLDLVRGETEDYSEVTLGELQDEYEDMLYPFICNGDYNGVYDGDYNGVYDGVSEEYEH